MIVNLARFLDVDPESALRRTTRKFRRRFEAMESAAKSQGTTLEQMDLKQMEKLWQHSKIGEEVKQ